MEGGVVLVGVGWRTDALIKQNKDIKKCSIPYK